jgi:D-amino-acid dehydrogenase
MKIGIIGGGVIGLTCAYYLQKAGHEVVVTDRGNGTNNCSFGNAGYISPSHFIPLASPGIVAQGLKWMLSKSSPFYIKPRLNMDLLRWGWKFYSHSTEKVVKQNAPQLNNILQLSRSLMIDMDRELEGGFELRQDGCFMLCRTVEGFHHEQKLSRDAANFGIDAPVLSQSEIQTMEPEVQVNVKGGVFFPIDCHVHPVHMMERLYNHLRANGTDIRFGTESMGFEKKDGKVTALITGKDKIEADEFVIAAGSWLPDVLSKLGISVLLQPGKGYSTTYTNVERNLHHPAILVEDRAAMTPLGRDLRIGGTMELSGINHDIKMHRVQPIVKAANTFYPDLNLEVPKPDQVWTGLRPVSPDGLPYIGRPSHWKNVSVAGGHAMLGVSLAAATGYLIRQIIMGEKTDIAMEAFRVER